MVFNVRCGAAIVAASRYRSPFTTRPLIRLVLRDVLEAEELRVVPSEPLDVIPYRDRVERLDQPGVTGQLEGAGLSIPCRIDALFQSNLGFGGLNHLLQVGVGQNSEVIDVL